MSARRIRILALASVSLVLLFLLLARSFMPGQSSGRSLRELSLLESIIKLVREDYIERVDPEKTMEGAFRGLVQSLDPLSSYLSKSDLADYLQGASVRFRDSGIILTKEMGGMPRVVGLEEGRPAAKSDLKPGDFLSAVDDQSTFGLSQLEIQLRLRSRESLPVRLRIVRQMATVEIKVGRALPPAGDCAYQAERNTAGVLTIRRMSPSLASEAAALIPPGLSSSSGPLILDLRTCAEGDAEGARRFINIFLKAPRAGGFLSHEGAEDPFSCPEEPSFRNIPLVIWTGHATIGAAEIAAAVLQDFKRAKVIGYPTPGLAAKQTLFPLEDGTALLLTTGVFVLASGEKLWEKGVVPDVNLDPQPSERASYLRRTLEPTGGR